MTKHQHQARQLIGNWLVKHKIKLIQPMAHVLPRCYVVARPNIGIITFAVPHMDCEPQIVRLNGANQYSMAHVFDKDIQVGDWVASAYIVTAHYGQPVAVAWPKPAPDMPF